MEVPMGYPQLGVTPDKDMVMSLAAELLHSALVKIGNSSSDPISRLKLIDANYNELVFLAQLIKD